MAAHAKTDVRNVANVCSSNEVECNVALDLSIVHFLADNQPGFARRIGHIYYAMNRWRGWRLCGIYNRRAGAALVAGDGRRVRVRLITQPTEVAA